MAKQVFAAKCKSCGKVIYPTHFYCPQCKGTKFEPTPIEGEGKLLTWTRVYTLPLDYSQRYITLGIVELDMGVRATGHLAVDEPKTGMRIAATVGPVRQQGGDVIDGLVFVAS